MTAHIIPAVNRRAISDWVAQGMTVTIRPDGTITISPAKPEPVDDFDRVDMRAK